jgi:hypothetical protein
MLLLAGNRFFPALTLTKNLNNVPFSGYLVVLWKHWWLSYIRGKQEKWYMEFVTALHSGGNCSARVDDCQTVRLPPVETT